MNEETIEQLDSERIRRIESASCKLLKNDPEGAKSDLAWAEMSSKVAAAGQKKSRMLLPIVVTGIVCLLLVGLMWTARCFSVQVSVEVMTNNVSVILAKDWASRHPFNSDKIFINNLTEITSPALNIFKKANPEKELMSAELKGTDITIGKLTLSEGSELEISSQGNILKLFVKGSPMSGELFVRKAQMSVNDEPVNIPENLDVPETIGFKTAKTLADAVRLELVLKENWQVRGLQIWEMDFSEEVMPGSGIFESALLSGKIRLPQTGYTEELREGDSLILKKVKKFRRLEISKNETREKGIRIFFEGTVSKISAGPSGFEKNLTPNWLEYLYHQERLTVFWGALVFLFGILWKLRGTIIG